MTLKIALAQINPTVGDISGNTQKILDAVRLAVAQGSDLVITPELALCGAAPEDLLLRDDFMLACEKALNDLCVTLSQEKIAVLLGHPVKREGARFNAASLVEHGEIKATILKQHLINAGYQDEARYFSANGECAQNILTIKGVRCRVTFGVADGERSRIQVDGAEIHDITLSLNASAYHIGHPQERFDNASKQALAQAKPLVYVNLVGAQDELIFDGGSFAVDAQGERVCQMVRFEEAVGYVDFNAGTLSSNDQVPELEEDAEIYQALMLGLRDYVTKNGFPGVLVGFSGGMDSAMALCLAVDALGAEKVRAVMMPSPYTSSMSLEDSREMAALLGFCYEEISIEPAMKTFADMLAGEASTSLSDTSEENIQARARGMILMAISNKSGDLVLSTGNKSEVAVGYCTLYGDMVGGLALLKDLFKTRVYQLARWRNRQSRAIPERIITRAPSAELKPGQTDQDNLPPYEVLDAIVEAYMERNIAPAQIIAEGFSEKDVRRVLHLMKISEYKRRQSAVGIRLTRRGFGKDWRYPVTNGYRAFSE